MRDKQALTESRRQDFHVLVRAWRAKLDAMYRSDLPDADKRVQKAELYAGMRADYEALKRDQWGGYTGYDHWFAKANNATMGTQAAYDDEVGAFERLFAAAGQRLRPLLRRGAADGGAAQARARRRDGAVSRGAAAGACRRARNTGVGGIGFWLRIPATERRRAGWPT